MLGTLDKIRILRETNIFHELVLDELAAISRICRRKWFDPGKEIFSSNGMEDAVYIVIEGEVDILLETKSGEKIIKCLGKNDFFSATMIFTDEEHQLAARTRTAVLMLEIRKDDLQKILTDYPNLTLKMFRFFFRSHKKPGEKNYDN